MDDAPDSSAPDPTLSGETLRAQKLDAVGRLAPGIIHELNNPFAAVIAFAEVLRRDPRLPEDLLDQAELLAGETARTHRLVQTLLDFLRIRPPERVATSVQALVDAVLVLHGYRLGSGGIEVAVDIPDDLPRVEVDRAQVELVLLNLVQESVDAILASGAIGRLRIEASVQAGGLALTVAHDATAGPADADLAWQVSTAIAGDHGGSLRRGPGRDGRGSTFTLTLPVALEAEAVPAGHIERTAVSAGPRADVPTGHAIRVLVLDDERPIRLLLQKWLRGSGYEPVVATTGEEAIALVRESTFDAILCDHRMAGMNGTEVYDAVVTLRPELDRRFVFMSGDVLNPQLREFVQERGVGLLAKPFDLDTVHRTLDSVLEIGAPRRS